MSESSPLSRAALAGAVSAEGDGPGAGGDSSGDSGTEYGNRRPEQNSFDTRNVRADEDREKDMSIGSSIPVQALLRSPKGRLFGTAEALLDDAGLARAA